MALYPSCVLGTRTFTQLNLDQPQLLSIPVLNRLRPESLMDALRPVGMHQACPSPKCIGKDCLLEGRARDW